MPFQKGHKINLGKHWKLSEKTKLKMSIGQRGLKRKPCSEETKKKISKANIGRFLKEKSYRWKGGSSYLNKNIRDLSIYKNWMLGVYSRDQFKCIRCGCLGGNLNAHHINNFAKLLENYNIKTLDDAIKESNLWNVSNGITLCKVCHKKFHYLYGYKCCLDDLLKFLKNENLQKYVSWYKQNTVLPTISR
jgi:hypothetical protein